MASSLANQGRGSTLQYETAGIYLKL